MSILFYHPKDEYGYFSNFSAHRVHIFGLSWPTSEHAFQAMKFYPRRLDLVSKVAKAGSPSQAARMGRDRSNPIRLDWDLPAVDVALLVPDRDSTVFDVDDKLERDAEHPLSRTKDFIMYVVLWAKFTQNLDIQANLLATGESILIEDSPIDFYWGQGSTKTGQNKLGRQLMALRTALRTGRGQPSRNKLDEILVRL